MSTPVTADHVALAHRLADASGAIIRRYFRTHVAVDDKSDASPVTIADREAERAIRDLIAAAAPDHGIIGEEWGSERADAEWVWVLDPIDGTKSFITGKPSFGTLIALAHRGRSVLGIVDQPITGERWIGGVGHPASLNGTPVRVRACPDLRDAYLYATEPEMFKGSDQDAFERLTARVKMRRYGADCYAYALLASGFVDLVCECNLKVHDHAAVSAVIEAAGGVVTAWDGAALGLSTNVCVLAAGDRRAHAAAMKALAG
ncbi:MAG: histidinol-phosphatase [Alphaproteobacteria bacterium]|nr:histidinol-phosphatase [Alphaproteobacteria bacterium]MBF0129614.1 histidinol-phosphatase [Alphaproteobacteria bacterium]